MLIKLTQLMRPGSRALVKLTYQGGVLRLTTEAIYLKAGLFGTGKAERFPLADMTRLMIGKPLPTHGWRGVSLRGYWASGREIALVGVGPLAATHFVRALRMLHPTIEISEE